MAAGPKLSSRKVPASKKTTPVVPRVSAKKQAVLNVSHLPPEYTEKELRAFFAQFGRVTKLRLSRSKKTARSRGYAYVQFDTPEVAKIAAEATNNYFIGGQPILVELMSHEAVLPGLFRGCSRHFTDLRPMREAINRKGHNGKTHSLLDATKLKADAARASKLAEAGIEYDFTRKVVKKKSVSA